MTERELSSLPPIRRIALLSVHTCPLATPGGYKTGGMNVYVLELSKELARRGLHVDIFTRCQESCYAHLEQPFDPSDPTLPVRLIHLTAGPERSLEPDAIYPYLPGFVAGIRNFVAREHIRYDVIYSHYWLSGAAAYPLQIEWDVPVIQMFHTLGLMKDRVAGTGKSGTRADSSLRDETEVEIMGWADRLIAATPAECAQMLWLYRAPRAAIDVVPPGVDTSRFFPGDPVEARTKIGLRPDQRLLLFVGRIEPLKAIDSILEALALVLQDTPELRDVAQLFVIGGDANGTDLEVKRLKAQCAALGLGDTVAFLGAKAQDVLPDYYRAAEALLMPSDYESFGMAALEAMASGVPVIAAQVGGLAFLIRDGENGYHVPTRDSAALAGAMRRALTDRAERDRLAANAADTARKYAWPRIADQLLTIFESARRDRANIAGLSHPYKDG